MKKLIAVALCCLLVASFAACGIDYAEQITGTWVCKKLESADQKATLMKNLELYEEEIALVDTALYTVKTVTFNADGTYFFSEDVQGVKDYLTDFYKGMFVDLYEGRASLSKCYETDISQLSEADFYQFYAELYSAESYDQLITQLVDSTYDYENFKNTEEGTYKVTSKVIAFDATEDAYDGNAKYEFEDGRLTIHYSDMTEVYYK